MKKSPARCETAGPRTEIEASLTPDQRRVTIDDHEHFLRSIATDSRGVDSIDRALEDELDEHLQIDPYVTGTSSRRSDKELARMLDMIDNLPISDNGKEGRD